MPYLGNSDFYAWQQIPEKEAQLLDEEDETETRFLPSQLRFEQSDSQLPSAATGSTGGASRRIQGEMRLPPLPPPSDPFLAPETEQRIDERHVEDESPVNEQKRVDLATFRASPASISCHCSRTLGFTVIWWQEIGQNVAKSLFAHQQSGLGTLFSWKRRHLQPLIATLSGHCSRTLGFTVTWWQEIWRNVARYFIF